MEDGLFLPVGGAEARPDDMTLPKARDLALCLAEGGIDHAILVECRRSGSDETVVFDVRIEVPNNRRVHAILRRERIAATFHEGDQAVPRVEALRKDFPEVPHLNLHLQDFPRNLCLYDERYEELKRGWTAPRFVHRVREWLALNAKGELHPEDQGLEPILVDFAGHIVLPHDLATGGVERLFATGIELKGRHCFLEAHREQPARAHPSHVLVVSVHRCQPQTHGVIHRCPQTLADVAELAQAAGLDLIDELRRALPTWKGESTESKVALVLVFPKRRTEEGPVEGHDTWCFAIGHSVGQLGIELGVWEEMNGELAFLLEVDPKKRGQGVSVAVLNPCFAMTRAHLSRLNGGQNPNDARIVGVGVGALGSQVVMNMARSGFGQWTLVDPDRLMPHNLARHALDGNSVGVSKAEAVACAAGTLSREEGGPVGLDADIFKESDEVRSALCSADWIIDMTASVAAQRHLTRDVDSPGRRACTFLSPSGGDLVVLAEDAERNTTLDALEMQYYRALLHQDGLAGHLESDGGRHRYARSCGDLTSSMPQDLVALHSAIASRNLRGVLAGEAPFIGVWRADVNSGVRYIQVEVQRVTEFRLGGWTVVLDDGLRECLDRSREEKLPNETGDVLLGSFDMERKILYVVDTLPSPPDSEERRDLYIRGCEGLREGVDGVERRSGGIGWDRLGEAAYHFELWDRTERYLQAAYEAMGSQVSEHTHQLAEAWFQRGAKDHARCFLLDALERCMHDCRASSTALDEIQWANLFELHYDVFVRLFPDEEGELARRGIPENLDDE